MKFIIILLITINCFSQQESRKVVFYSVKNCPVVRAEINGKKAYFLVDSGSSFSIINSKSIGRFKFRETTTSTKINGINSTGNMLNEVESIRVHINGRKVDVEFLSMDLEKLKKNLGVDGILGSDWMRKNKIIIDYKRSILWLRK